MRISPLCASEVSAFDRLHPEIRRWIWEQKWDELREVQSRAITTILSEKDDALIAAATAAGKTEAAFLPILTEVAERKEPGIAALYVSPLKALINDQFRRLEPLCERLGIEVVRWHGDAPQSGKTRILKAPSGIALITPESIEAMLIRRPRDAHRLFAAVDFVVIDELHAFLQGPRGLHLASLLRRLDRISARRARRIGLSATIGDLQIAAAWLHPEAPQTVSVIEAAGDRAEIKIQVRAYLDPPDVDDIDGLEEDEGPRLALDDIADHVFETLRGENNLVFAGSRRRVEALADRLRRRSETAGVPNEFFPHHGSLSKDLRHELELRLKKADLPTTAVATTTLELGIDIGSVKSVAQIGAPRSLSSLRQRLGRSGRRKGVPAILRNYVRDRHIPADADPLDRIRPEVVRAVAAVRLLVAKFVEPPGTSPALATVALHQTLSIIVERGGERADRIYATLCGSGPLSAITAKDFGVLLRGMASPQVRLIEQAPDGTIMLGEMGERLTSGRDFYAIFDSDQEWRLVASGRPLGTIPLSNVVSIGSLLGFAGRRWRVESVDDAAHVLDVAPHPSGRLPKFDRLSVEGIHDRLATEMRTVWMASDAPAYLDQVAAEFLREGRAAFRELSLETKRIVPAASDTHVLLWRGAAFSSTFAVALTSAGLECEVHDFGVTIADTSPVEAAAILGQMAAAPPPNADDLSEFVGNLKTAKFDEYVPDSLLRALWARSNQPLCQQIPATAAVLIEKVKAPG
ncbi:DEAD/DEAH box helicase [Acuticoccus sediminis]|uniref:DEAD/DEAH box helicase n=2 Tax=Acuticoccus sediminis TaxID=2184697 RepID=A0A8B2NH23_9HYPH|nr:DEAD/DEAH box helicase [Acuticoccus sediminis]